MVNEPLLAGQSSDQLAEGSKVTIGGNAPSIADPEPEQNSQPHRFPLLKFRHASESQLATKARQHAGTPPLPKMQRREFECRTVRVANIH